jgi:predicted MFS family arabinose efflux permease
MIGGITAVAVGCIVAALASNLGVLIVGRALQGTGLGLVPLAMATARDELPTDRVAPMIGLLSVSTAVGAGAGYPISGLIADRLGLSAAYWFGAIVSGIALVCVAAVLPASNRGSRQARLDVFGALLFSAALLCILISIAQGEAWRWGSRTILGLFILSVFLLVIWSFQQLRSSHPLVDLHLLKAPAVLAADVCAMVLSIAMYMMLSSVTEFVQLPRAEGFGFSASVVEAGLILVPMSLCMLAGSRLLPRLVKHVGVRALLTIGCMVVSLSCVFFALLHDSEWQSFVTMGILGLGLGITYAAIPGQIVQAVPERETGSAMGFYQVVRYVGFSTGSALTASILASHSSGSQPSLNAYTTVFWVAGAICVAAALLAWILPALDHSTPPGNRLGEDETKLVEQTEGEDLVISTGSAFGEPIPQQSERRNAWD